MISIVPSSSEVALTLKGEGIVEVRLNRPEKLNALTEEMYAALTDVFRRLHEDASVRAIILTGEGRGFCSGSDIGGMQVLRLVRAFSADMLRFRRSIIAKSR